MKAFITLWCLVGNVFWFQATEDTKMECGFSVDMKTATVGEAVAGHVELKNVSKKDITIVYNTDPFEHLDLVVLDPSGKKISSKYGGLFSPSSPLPKRTLTL